MDYAVEVIVVKMLSVYIVVVVVVVGQQVEVDVVEFEGDENVIEVVLDVESKLLSLQLNNRDWMKLDRSEWDVV